MSSPTFPQEAWALFSQGFMIVFLRNQMFACSCKKSHPCHRHRPYEWYVAVKGLD